MWVRQKHFNRKTGLLEASQKVVKPVFIVFLEASKKSGQTSFFSLQSSLFIVFSFHCLLQGGGETQVCSYWLTNCLLLLCFSAEDDAIISIISSDSKFRVQTCLFSFCPFFFFFAFQFYKNFSDKNIQEWWHDNFFSTLLGSTKTWFLSWQFLILTLT